MLILCVYIINLIFQNELFVLYQNAAICLKIVKIVNMPRYICNVYTHSFSFQVYFLLLFLSVNWYRKED